MSAPAVDREKHLRERVRLLDRENLAHLWYRQRIEAVLALAVEIIAAKQATTPADVLAVLEKIVEASGK